VAARGEATRARLLDAAVLLFAERGLGGVSLREINEAAGQRNTNALHYHFGDRDGLIGAMAARHTAVLAERQRELFEASEAEGTQRDLRTLLGVLQRPSAEYVARGRVEGAWVRVAAQLLTSPRTATEDIVAGVPEVLVVVGRAIVDLLSPPLPEDLAIRRLQAVSESAAHLIADRARLAYARKPTRAGTDLALFTSELLDLGTAALQAPVTAETEGLLRSAGPVALRRPLA
jgi:AcrR family transcriptional regulator